MMNTTPGQLLINEGLPTELQDHGRRLNKKSLASLMAEVHERFPEKYKSVVQHLQRVGADVSHAEGGSFTLDDLKTPPWAVAERKDLSNQVTAILKRGTAHDEDDVVKMILDRQNSIQSKLYQSLKENRNSFAEQVSSGARGNPTNLRSMVFGDLLVTDNHDRPIPVPILHGYAEGLDPAEYWAASYGARRGVVLTKFCMDGDTPVRMVDQPDRLLKNIIVGNMVWGVDRAGNMRPVKVTRVWPTGMKVCRRYLFRKGRTGVSLYRRLVATADHKVMWRISNELVVLPLSAGHKAEQPDDVVHVHQNQKAACLAENGALSVLKLRASQAVGMRETFDLEVDHPDHLFVLANGLVVSNSTQDAGAWGKQVAQAAHTVKVRGQHGLPGTGLPIDTDDPDLPGYVLAQDVDTFKKGQIIDAKIAAKLRDQRARVLVHSTIEGLSEGGYVPAEAAGVRERGKLPRDGEHIGLLSAQALGEKLSQLQLSSKHGGGVVGISKHTLSGFDLINNLIQVPKSFHGAATVASIDGHVSKIEPAPQGGSYVFVDDISHYLAEGVSPTVAVGDVIEAGDALNDGIPNPAEVVLHRGIGEGRRQFAKYFAQAYRASGLPIHRRNAEVLARGLINTVRVTEPDVIDGALPGDYLDYDELAARYLPRDGAQELKPKSATGKYLERPALHYSIGTRVTPKVAQELNEFGVASIIAHDNAPPFEPHMKRAMELLSVSPDWLTRFGGSYQERGFLEATHRGRDSKLTGKSFIPSIITGTL